MCLRTQRPARRCAAACHLDTPFPIRVLGEFGTAAQQVIDDDLRAQRRQPGGGTAAPHVDSHFRFGFS
jgi:hypothetical protein